MPEARLPLAERTEAFTLLCFLLLSLSLCSDGEEGVLMVAFGTQTPSTFCATQQQYIHVHQPFLWAAFCGMKPSRRKYSAARAGLRIALSIGVDVAVDHV